MVGKIVKNVELGSLIIKLGVSETVAHPVANMAPVTERLVSFLFEMCISFLDLCECQPNYDGPSCSKCKPGLQGADCSETITSNLSKILGIVGLLVGWCSFPAPLMNF